jgi:phosphoribosyl-ATP pyrophosphohydrolase
MVRKKRRKSAVPSPKSPAMAKKNPKKKGGTKRHAEHSNVVVLPRGRHAGHMLDRLFAIIESRKGADPATSYTARLMARGRIKIAQKLGEEAVEAAIEGVRKDPEKLVLESADLLYHLLALWAAVGVRPDQVWSELADREGISGIAEKASRRSAAE